MRHDGRNRKACLRQSVGMRHRICGQVDNKTALVRGPNCGQVAKRKRFMGIGKTALANVGVHQFSQGLGVNLVSDTGQVSGLIVPPQLPGRESADLGKEGGPVKTALSTCNL
jgi:hypothetical protein